MGYDLNKTYYLEFGELDKQGIPTISSIFGSNNIKLQLHSKGVEFKLGSSSTDIEAEFRNIYKDNRASYSSSSYCCCCCVMEPFTTTVGGPSKRGRTQCTGPQQAVSCLVDGCNSDLSKCRDYHRRHKVCEVHSKTPRVTIAGLEQRFCQQCSRFHSLGEFDEGKRSCRKRLEGHNRRRRKPQPDPLPLVNHGIFSSATQGSRYYGLSNEAMVPTASSVVSSSNRTRWGAVKNESNPPAGGGLYNYSSSSSSSVCASSYVDAYRPPPRQLPFAVGSGSSSSAHMFHQDHNKNKGMARLLLCDGITNQVVHTVSDGALSLLSSSPAHTCDMELGPSSLPNPTPINPTRPMITDLHYNSMVSYLGLQYHQPAAAAAATSGSISNLTSNHSLCHNVFTGQADASSSPSSSASASANQTISFSWE